jgi:hypothetical protein
MAPTDSPVTPEPKPAVVWADRPIMVEVVCPNCATGTVLGGPCAFCQGFALVLPLSPSSLAARYIELGRAMVRHPRCESILDLIAWIEAEVYPVIERVQAHADFRPDQKEGTHDA